jgi:hypothetical protein
VAENRVIFDELANAMIKMGEAAQQASVSLNTFVKDGSTYVYEYKDIKWEPGFFAYDLAPPGSYVKPMQPAKPKVKVTDNRRWDRPGYAGFWRDKPYWMSYSESAYWEQVAEQLGRQHWLGEVKSRFGLITSEAGCASIRPKPDAQLDSDEWDEFKARWAA